MSKGRFQVVAVFAMGILVSLPAYAFEGLTWFGETTFTGAYPTESALEPVATAGSSIPESWKNSPYTRTLETLDSKLPMDEALLSADLNSDLSSNQLRSELGMAFGAESISIPLTVRRNLAGDGTEQAQNAWGVKWRHRFSDSNQLTVSARYGNNRMNNSDLSVSASKLAAVSWTSALADQGASSITGSVFFGNEAASDKNDLEASRKVYGLALGGKWSVSPKHTPFVAYRYQAGYDEMGTTALTAFEFGDAANISAGWNWQVAPNWSFQAEARFGYNSPTLDLFDVKSTRVFFTTRYDFR